MLLNISCLGTLFPFLVLSIYGQFLDLRVHKRNFVSILITSDILEILKKYYEMGVSC